MVMKTTQHLGKEPSLAKKTVQFQELNKTERIWTNFKAYYHKALRAVKQEHKCFGAEPDYQANSAAAARNAKEAAEQKACEDIADKVSGPFNALASTAVAKAESINNHTATIAALTKTNAELVETNKRLVTQLTAAKLPFSPPGFRRPTRRSYGPLLTHLATGGARTKTWQLSKGGTKTTLRACHVLQSKIPASP